ncbi:MAG: AbrB/MazE/SpoVT family DNA-binding domain-containing protein [Candidatus Nanohaloarchaea archaeon]
MPIEAEDGRVYIPKDLRDRMGSRFELIDRGDRIVLLPVPEDPLEELREEWEDVDKSVEELKKEAVEEAAEQAGR